MIYFKIDLNVEEDKNKEIIISFKKNEDGYVYIFYDHVRVMTLNPENGKIALCVLQHTEIIHLKNKGISVDDDGMVSTNNKNHDH